MTNPWTAYNTARMARDRRAAQLLAASKACLFAAAVILTLTIAVSLIRAAAITGANLPHTLAQSSEYRNL